MISINLEASMCPLLRSAIMVLIAVVGVASTATADTASICDASPFVNMVNNCGFENDTLSGWMLGGNMTNPPGDFDGDEFGVDALDANSGNYGAYFGPIGSAMTLTQDISVSADVTYYLSFFLEQDSAPVTNSNHIFSVSFDNNTLLDADRPDESDAAGLECVQPVLVPLIRFSRFRRLPFLCSDSALSLQFSE